jgi:hypothetical protein
MLKLLKYDWKRARALAGILGVTVLLEAGIEILARLQHWSVDPTLVIQVLIYAVAGVGMVATAASSYAANLRSPQRRLLPLPSLHTLLSSLLFGVLALLAVFLLAVVHGWLSHLAGSGEGYAGFGAILNAMELGQLVDLTTPFQLFLGAVMIAWSGVFSLLAIFLAVTIGASLQTRRKYPLRISILIFFVFQSLFYFVEYLLFNTDKANSIFRINLGASAESAIHTKVLVDEMNQAWPPMLFEMALALVMIYVMVRLIDRYVEA